MAIQYSPAFWKRLAFAYFWGTTALLLWPGNAFPATKLINIPYFDKIIHIILFALLYMLLIQALSPVSKRGRVQVAVLVILYGILIEFVQLYFIPFRSFEIVDILADSAGVGLGILCSMAIRT